MIFQLYNFYYIIPAIFDNNNSYVLPGYILSDNFIWPVGNLKPVYGNSNPFVHTFSTLLFSSNKDISNQESSVSNPFFFLLEIILYLLFQNFMSYEDLLLSKHFLLLLK